MASIFDSFDDVQPTLQEMKDQQLFSASARGDRTRVQTLLSEKIANPSCLVNGFNALHISTRKGHYNVVELLITYDPSLCSTRTGTDSRTAAMIAAYEGHTDIVRLLDLHYSCDQEEPVDVLGNSCLHYGAWGGSLEITKFLVDICGKDSSLKNNEGLSPLQMASAGNHVEVIEYLSRKVGCDLQSTSSTGYNSIHRAAIYGSVDTLWFLLPQESSMAESRTENNSTPLMLACQHGKFEVVKYLIDEYDVEINCTNDWDLSALHYGCVNGDATIVKFLLQRGADPSAVNAGRANILHLAAANGHRELCKIITNIPGKNFFRADSDGNTPIDAALSSGFRELASVLAGYSFAALRAHSLLSHIDHTVSIEQILVA